MNTPKSPDAVKVMQEDRDAARGWLEGECHKYLANQREHDLLAEHFARHRLSSSPSGIGADLLADAARQFRLYEELHRAKGTPDAYEKSKVNGAFAHRIECFLNSGVDHESARSQSRMGEGEDERAWLIERRVQPPQWSIVRDPTGIGAFYSDVHRAHRFPTKEAAREAMRRMCITPEERGQYFVSEHIWVDGASVAAPYFGMDEQEFEDFLADAIDDSMDMDWTGRVGAKSVIRALSSLTPKEQ
jgi:hypothetical protein